MHQIQLTKAVQEKGGNIGYRREGVRATVYFNKNIFNGAVPETVTITADGDTNPFTQPGETRAGGTPNPERAAKAAERAQKAQERAAKAAERAAKAQARADKLAGKTAAAATE